MERVRRRLLLILMIIVFVLGFSTSFLMVNALSTKKSLLEAESYMLVQMNRFRDLAIDINRSFIDTISGEWLAFSNNNDNINIDDFVEQGIRPLKSSAYRSLIVVVYDSNEELIYNFAEYGDFDYYAHDLTVGSLIVLGDSGNDVFFGQGDRFYIEGVRLYDQDDYFDVYIGFSEGVMYDNFISVIEVGMVREIKNKVANIVFISWFLGVAILMIIFYVIYYAQCLQFLLGRSVEDDLECYKRALVDLKERMDRGGVV